MDCNRGNSRPFAVISIHAKSLKRHRLDLYRTHVQFLHWLALSVCRSLMLCTTWKMLKSSGVEIVWFLFLAVTIWQIDTFIGRKLTIREGVIINLSAFPSAFPSIQKRQNKTHLIAKKQYPNGSRSGIWLKLWTADHFIFPEHWIPLQIVPSRLILFFSHNRLLSSTTPVSIQHQQMLQIIIGQSSFNVLCLPGSHEIK